MCRCLAAAAAVDMLPTLLGVLSGVCWQPPALMPALLLLVMSLSLCAAAFIGSTCRRQGQQRRQAEWGFQSLHIQLLVGQWCARCEGARYETHCIPHKLSTLLHATQSSLDRPKLSFCVTKYVQTNWFYTGHNPHLSFCSVSPQQCARV